MTSASSPARTSAESGTNIIGTAANLGSVGQGLNLGVINGKINIPGVGEVLNLAFLARALETTADANILSTPTIQTLDNEEAKFLVGQNIPLITGAFANAGGNAVAGVNPFQTFERKDIGLQLRVRPQISEGGVVRLAIYQELSSIQNTLTAAQGGIITNKRSFESTVLVEDGNIVVLGGLIEDRSDNSRSSLPLLGASRGWAISSATRTAAARRPTCSCSCGRMSSARKASPPRSRSTATRTSAARSPRTRSRTTSCSAASRARSCRRPCQCRRRCGDRRKAGSTAPAPVFSAPDATSGPPVPRAEPQSSPAPKPSVEGPAVTSAAPVRVGTARVDGKRAGHGSIDDRACGTGYGADVIDSTGPADGARHRQNLANRPRLRAQRRLHPHLSWRQRP